VEELLPFHEDQTAELRADIDDDRDLRLSDLIVCAHKIDERNVGCLDELYTGNTLVEEILNAGDHIEESESPFADDRKDLSFRRRYEGDGVDARFHRTGRSKFVDQFTSSA
jgi:hypothetical protein